jgi:hypothetical protein
VASVHTIPLQTATLLLLGGNSPPFCRIAAEALHDALPNSRIVVLPGQSHGAIPTAPDLFIREVVRFLRVSPTVNSGGKKVARGAIPLVEPDKSQPERSRPSSQGPLTVCLPLSAASAAAPRVLASAPSEVEGSILGNGTTGRPSVSDFRLASSGLPAAPPIMTSRLGRPAP